MDLAHLRREYTRHGLDEGELLPEPLEQFELWLHQALEAGVPEATAMTLATVAEDGHPRARIVLLKLLDSRGLGFFTHYTSEKGRELQSEPRASLSFHWVELERQVRIEGRAQRLPAEESDAYFQSRPRESQLSAWASPQSRPVASRQELLDQLEAAEARFGPEGPIPRPAEWGGYILLPERFEFWQGRPARLHDRLRYQKDASERWRIERLGP